MNDPARVESRPLLADADTGSATSSRGQPVEAEPREQRPGLVEGREHGKAVDARELEVLLAAPGAMWMMPVPSSRATSSQGITRWTTPRCAASSSKGPSYWSPTSSAPSALRRILVRGARSRPLPALAQPVVGVGLDRRGDVRRQRPGRRRPDQQRLALAPFERKAHVERRMLTPGTRRRELVLEIGAAARAPGVERWPR